MGGFFSGEAGKAGEAGEAGAAGRPLLAVTLLAGACAVVLGGACGAPEEDGCPAFSFCCPEPEPAVTYGALWSDSIDFLATIRSDGVLLVYDGDGLEEVPLDRSPRKLWGQSRDTLYASCDGGAYHFDGQGWGFEPSPFPDETCWVTQWTGEHAGYGRCSGGRVVSFADGDLTSLLVLSGSQFLFDLTWNETSGLWLSGTQGLYTGDNLVGFLPLLLNNDGHGWLSVHTPWSSTFLFDEDTEQDDPEADPVFHSGGAIQSWPGGEVQVESKELLGGTKGSLYFDGETWSWLDYGLESVVEDTTGFPYSRSPTSSNTLRRWEDDQWQTVHLFDSGYSILSLAPADGGVFVSLCMLRDICGWNLFGPDKECDSGHLAFRADDGEIRWLSE